MKKNLFIPNEYFEGSQDEFWKKIPNIDAEFEEKTPVTIIFRGYQMQDTLLDKAKVQKVD